MEPPACGGRGCCLKLPRASLFCRGTPRYSLGFVVGHLAMAVSKQALLDAVRSIDVPGLTGSLLELRMITELDVAPEGVRVVLTAAAPDYPHKEQLAALVRERLGAVASMPVEVLWKTEVASRNIAADDPVPGAKNIVLV